MRTKGGGGGLNTQVSQGAAGFFTHTVCPTSEGRKPSLIYIQASGKGRGGAKKNP